MKKGKETGENKEQYISLIELLLQNITDLEGIKLIYQFAQSIWFHEKSEKR